MTPEQRYRRITGLDPTSERFTNGRKFNEVGKTRRMMVSRRLGQVSGEAARRLLKARERQWVDE